MPVSQRKSPCIAAAMAALILGFPVGATAAEAGIDRSDGAYRIDLASELGMLSHRLGAAACNGAAGIGGAGTVGTLRSTLDDAERILGGLRAGDDTLGLAKAETDTDILRRLSDMDALWRPISTDPTLRVVDVPHDADVALTLSAAPVLVAATERLVGEVVGHYADPSALVAADAIMLDIMGRARTLPQMMSSHACMIAEGQRGPLYRAAIADAVALYDRVVVALRKGDPDVGIAPPTAPRIVERLDEVQARWDAIRPTLVAVADGARPTDENREAIHAAADALTDAMDDVIEGYAARSRIELWVRDAPTR